VYYHRRFLSALLVDATTCRLSGKDANGTSSWLSSLTRLSSRRSKLSSSLARTRWSLDARTATGAARLGRHRDGPPAVSIDSRLAGVHDAALTERTAPGDAAGVARLLSGRRCSLRHGRPPGGSARSPCCSRRRASRRRRALRRWSTSLSGRRQSDGLGSSKTESRDESARPDVTGSADRRSSESR